MARIHIARSLGAEGFSRLVAAKRLDPQLANDAEFVEMFLDEARVASKVRHRNVVPVLDVVTIDGEVIMVQELVHGAPLHKLFNRAQLANLRIPVNVAVSIAMQTLCGLHAAHEAVDETGTSLGIVHRDVSPQNIMIATDGTARLLDFGVAKTAAAAHITRAGTFKGKLAYSSPEQLTGNVTRQTDLYALAIVLWELLTGERMHAGRSEAEVYATIMSGTPPSLLQVLAKRRAAGKLDNKTWVQIEALDPVLQKAFARDVNERYATAAELEQALLDIVQPAALADVAVWLRSLAQDILDHTDQLIAAEEASWRKAKGSGVVPMKLTSAESRRASTSLETQAAIPSARARSFDANRSQGLGLAATNGALAGTTASASRFALPSLAGLLRRELPPLAFAIADGVAVVLMVLLLVGRSSAPHPVAAAAAEPARITRMKTLAIASPPANRPAASDSAIEEPPPPTAHAPAKRRPVMRRPAKKIVPKAARKPADCSIPFYYEGSKKIFKPSCI